MPRKLETNGEKGTLDQFQQWGSGKTLRQLVTDNAGGLVSSVELIGTPDTVAARMGEVMAEVGGDGFMLTTPLLRLNRRYIADLTDGLIPASSAAALPAPPTNRAGHCGNACWNSDHGLRAGVDLKST